MKVPIYQIDAFADNIFEGNPAAVAPLQSWLSDTMMQAIAAENNLSETAFFCPRGENRDGCFDLRWFTPTSEVDLCGHATLASAHVILHFLQPDLTDVSFSTRSGKLTVRRGVQGMLDMDFPALSVEPVRASEGNRIADELARVLGARPEKIYRGANLLAVFANEQEIHSLTYAPALQGVLSYAKSWGLVATAPGDLKSPYDFVSRFFAPEKGVPEDPVTGSAHCLMTPYWAERLGRDTLVGRQVSVRGGTVFCRLNGPRVQLSGRCAPYLEGSITLK